MTGSTTVSMPPLHDASSRATGRRATAAAVHTHARHRNGYEHLAVLLLILVALILSGRVHATCADTSNPGSVTFTPPGGQITLSGNDTIGSVVWTSTQAIPANYPTLNCTGTTNNGIVSSYGPPTGSDETLYPTNLSWLSYRILHPDATSYLSAYQYNASVPTGNVAFSIASALELVITGTIPKGLQGTSPQLTIPAGQLAQWNVDMTSGTKPVEIFYITNVQFIVPTCTAAIDPTVVTLSAVLATAFTGQGSTAAQQPFHVQLNCIAGAHLSITLSTTGYYSTKSLGVIYNNNTSSNTTGYARHIGVQILQQNDSTPVTFDTAIPEGTTTNGTMSLPFYAQYYQTSNTNVTLGDVSATATYTLTYN